MVVEKRLPRIGPDHCRFDRTLRGATYVGAKRSTLGRASENTVPVVPSAHRLGRRLALEPKAVQSGIGVAAPMHVSCCMPLGRPEVSSAGAVPLTPGLV